MRVVFFARGHENISATHRTTLEFTKKPDVGPRGTCIVGVRSDLSCAELPEDFKSALRSGKKVKITISAGPFREAVTGFGSPRLELSHPEDIVVRKSGFADSRTLCIFADKSASDLSRGLAEVLRDPGTKIKVVLEIQGS